ncbi:hypothetical protein SAMN02745165_02284 [Malonomonas rubra DSM 5091]|uniref:Uncharacterized protein n=2 Tax=Malonomonas rubra TaxID=57040 RepID=A0A1M6IXN2_MALRU|nr:hypothetical protein SAMN02745165_02284 [Malonomonas rubra DSM 5091]
MSLRKIFCLFLFALFVLAPYSLSFDTGKLVTADAFAKGGNGNGNGNGNGGGNGNGVGNSNGHSHGPSHGNGLGAAKESGSLGKAEKNIASASKLGRLNAAHASATARANASPNSAVGRIAAYEAAVYGRMDAQSQLEALQSDPSTPQAELDAALTAVEVAVQAEMETLAAAANKDVDQDVAQAVNDLLGIDEGTEEAAAAL